MMTTRLRIWNHAPMTDRRPSQRVEVMEKKKWITNTAAVTALICRLRIGQYRLTWASKFKAPEMRTPCI